MSWAALGAIILGGLLLKAIFDSDTTVHRCPYCNLVLQKGKTPCPRCKNVVVWDTKDG